jgi:hypothetical protein
MLDCETSNSKSEASKSKSWKNYFFLENYIISEGASGTLFYTVHISPLLDTK